MQSSLIENFINSVYIIIIIIIIYNFFSKKRVRAKRRDYIDVPSIFIPPL